MCAKIKTCPNGGSPCVADLENHPKFHSQLEPTKKTDICLLFSGRTKKNWGVC